MLLLYLKAINRSAANLPAENRTPAMKSVVADLSLYDWEGDTHLRRPFAKTVIYEMHVGGFTRNPNSMIELFKKRNICRTYRKNSLPR